MPRDQLALKWRKLNPWVVYPTLDPRLHLSSSNHDLSFVALFNFLVWTDFPSNWCHVYLASICHFWVMDPHLKDVGPIYGSHTIGLLYSLDPRPSSRVALRVCLTSSAQAFTWVLACLPWMVHWNATDSYLIRPSQTFPTVISTLCTNLLNLATIIIL
jgi:hypothetical protein